MVKQPCFVAKTEQGKNGGASVNYKICCSKAYAQTLFLGCSIKSFVIALGWGSESSRLTVELVRDTCKYPSLLNSKKETVKVDMSPDDYTEKRKNKQFEQNENGIDLIPGKVYYEPNNGKLVSMYYLEEDPGFYGDMPDPKDTIDLIGTPVYFKYDDFEFAGIVKSWEKNGDQSTATNSYSVNIESPAFLLKHTSMILGGYTGSVFSKETEADKYGFPRYQNGIYAGKIKEQDIPNVINVFGYLEDITNITTNLPFYPGTDVPQYSYGRSGRNDDGIPASNVLVAINDLLSYDKDGGTSGFTKALTQQKILRYSSYARIIGKAAKYKLDGKNFTLKDAEKDKKKNMKIGMIFGMNYGSVQSSYGPEHRMAYTVDLSAFQDGSIPEFYRINQDSMTLFEFIDTISSNTGKEIFVSLVMSIDKDNNIYPIIKINTVSVLSPSREGAVQSFIEYVTSLGDSVQSYTIGHEFNADQPVRTMYIGGKQQRLYQVRNYKYASKQTTLRYNSFLNIFSTINHTELNSQETRYPNPVSYRNPALSYNKATPAGARSSAVYLPDLSEFNNIETFGREVLQGNYYSKNSLNAVGIIPTLSDLGMSPQSNWFDATNDTICPYFGNNLITNTVRKVYHHATGYIVEFSTQEIGLAIGRSFGVNDVVGISETEIRAAMSGFDSFYGFIFGVMSDAKNIGSARPDFGNGALQIYSKVIMPLLGIPSRHNIHAFFSSLNRGLTQVNNKINNSFSGSQAVPLSSSASFMADVNTYDTLSKLHQFIKNIGDTYYGKQFMVSIQDIEYWQDGQSFSFDPTLPTDCSNSVVIGFSEDNSPILLSRGTNKFYFGVEPVETAWEEYFNFVDDLLVVGSPNMDALTSENNSIYPILGYSSNPQYNYIKEFNDRVWNTSKNFGAGQQFFHFWKFDAYRNAGAKYTAQNLAGIDYWVPSLSMQDDAGIIMSYNAPIYSNISEGNPCAPIAMNRGPANEFNAFGLQIPQDKMSKTYIKADLNKEIQPYFSIALGRIVPKIIIKNNTGTFLNPLAPYSLSVTTAIAEFLSNNYAGLNAIIASKILSGADHFTTPGQMAGFGSLNAGGQNKDNNQFNNMSISPKAVMPVFAGVPLQYNTAVYGPWVSSADPIKTELFANNVDVRIENLVGGTKIEIEDELVPWNYGGMRYLDEAALIKAAQDNNYQLQMETGQITVNGGPTLGIGTQLKGLAYEFGGPTVNNINVQVGQNGVSTTYTFRTFTRKFTLFNKESADRIKAVTLGSIKSNKELRQQIRKITEQLLAINAGVGSSVSPYDLSGSKLGQYSPLTVLVGYSHPYLSPLAGGNFGFWPRPGEPARYSKDSIRQLTTISVQDARELPSEFNNLYSCKSFMSLDGLLTPVSFYPTYLNSTNAYKPYFQINCPICNGTKSYTVENNKVLYCHFCSDKVAGQEPGLPEFNLKIPPFILSNELPENIIANPNAIQNILQRNTKQINYISLNPIIMPVGELRNKYAQDNDFTSHHIDIIGRSLVPMAGSLSITDNTSINQDDFFGKLNLADQNGSALNGVPPSDLDWNSYAFDINNGIPNNRFHLMNHRFLALRGPLVLSGWGFDTEGYPVPNSSGEPQIVDADGWPKRIASPQDAGGGFANYPGTVLGKNQQWDPVAGKWTDPYRENTFYKGWGLRPDSWPVGPIDLRWDHKRKVWTSAQQVVFAEVQLEDDLAPAKVARAFLNAADKEAPLANGLKRMVLVKDESESFGAPRGAKLYCKYDDITGFYSPVTRQNIITSGLITSSNTAMIYDGYAKGFDENIGELQPPDKVAIKYNNFLGLPITDKNQNGLFIYLTNQWILMSTKTC